VELGVNVGDGVKVAVGVKVGSGVDVGVDVAVGGAGVGDGSGSGTVDVRGTSATIGSETSSQRLRNITPSNRKTKSVPCSKRRSVFRILIL
jgi:hypothetical protein